MGTLAVVERILKENNEPLSVKEIVKLAGADLPTRSRTPDTVVARDLSMDIKKHGKSSKFMRTSPGRYTLRALALELGSINRDDGSSKDQHANEVKSLISHSLDRGRMGPIPMARVSKNQKNDKDSQSNQGSISQGLGHTSTK